MILPCIHKYRILFLFLTILYVQSPISPQLLFTDFVIRSRQVSLGLWLIRVERPSQIFLNRKTGILSLSADPGRGS